MTMFFNIFHPQNPLDYTLTCTLKSQTSITFCYYFTHPATFCNSFTIVCNAIFRKRDSSIYLCHHIFFSRKSFLFF